MSWLRWLLLGDLSQQLDLEEQREALEQLRRARSKDRGAVRFKRVEQLEADCDELKMYVASLVRLLVRKGIATEEEVVEIVSAVDLEDGVRDGKNRNALAALTERVSPRVKPEAARRSGRIPIRSRRRPRS